VQILSLRCRGWALEAFRPNAYPVSTQSNPYVPTNSPAIDDLFDLFDFNTRRAWSWRVGCTANMAYRHQPMGDRRPFSSGHYASAQRGKLALAIGSYQGMTSFVPPPCNPLLFCRPERGQLTTALSSHVPHCGRGSC
jgi:hypothetical protein